MRIALALVVIGCESSPKPAPAPASAPVMAEPAPTKVAKGGDPEEGGEVAAAEPAKPAAEPAKPAAEQRVLGAQSDSVGGLDVPSGGGQGGMRGRRVAAPHVKLGEPTVKGQLDKAIVRRYVNRNLNKLQYCYEKQLLANPGIAGHVVATFTIGDDGKVSGAHAKAFDTEVGTCIETALGMIEYPKPKGGSVDVSYPMDFAQSQ